MIDNDLQIKINKYDLLFESRLTKVETSLIHLDKTIDELDKTVKTGFSEIRSDIKWMFGMMLGFSGILLSVMAKGFHWF